MLAVISAANIKTKEKMKECLRCGHKWWPRIPTKKPVLCPSCKSKYWDQVREETTKKGK
jgi:DNA-directed RNA polymerase subunit RPC12/RpoP